MKKLAVLTAVVFLFGVAGFATAEETRSYRAQTGGTAVNDSFLSPSGNTLSTETETTTVSKNDLEINTKDSFNDTDVKKDSYNDTDIKKDSNNDTDIKKNSYNDTDVKKNSFNETEADGEGNAVANNGATAIAIGEQENEFHVAGERPTTTGAGTTDSNNDNRRRQVHRGQQRRRD